MTTLGNEEKSINNSKKPLIFKQKEIPVFNYDIKKSPDFKFKKRSEHK